MMNGILAPAARPLRVLGVVGLVVLGACSTGDGYTASPSPTSSDQSPFFDDQRPFPPEETLPPLTEDRLCMDLCAAAERCLPPDVDCFAACQSPDASAAFGVEACLTPEPDRTPVPIPQPMPDAGGGGTGGGDAGDAGLGDAAAGDAADTCLPAMACMCPDPCQTCLCMTNGDVAGCQMSGSCL